MSIELVKGEELFPGLGFEGRSIPRLKDRGALVPTSNTHYQPDPALLRKALAWWFMPKRNLSFTLYGETGTGKTEFWAYLCDKLNWPMIIVSVSESLRPESVKSGLAMKNGETVHELSAAAKAAEMGALLVLDEMDKGSLDFLAALHPLMEYKGLPLEKQGRVIIPHPLFRLVATCQTNGTGDVSGRYQSCQPLDEAVRRRFMWAQANYPAADVEELILLSEVPKLPAKLRRLMCRFAAKSRQALEPTGLQLDGHGDQRVFAALSTRVVVEWARMLFCLGKDATPKEAFELVFLSSTEEQDTKVFALLAELTFGDAWDAPWAQAQVKAA